MVACIIFLGGGQLMNNSRYYMWYEAFLELIILAGLVSSAMGCTLDYKPDFFQLIYNIAMMFYCSLAYFGSFYIRLRKKRIVLFVCCCTPKNRKKVLGLIWFLYFVPAISLFILTVYLLQVNARTYLYSL